MALLKLTFLMILLIPKVLKAEGKVGGNYLRYTNEHFAKDHSYKGWFSITEPFRANDKFGLGLYGQYERLYNGEGLYREFKPYYEFIKGIGKIDLQVVQDGWKSQNGDRFEQKTRIGVGFEYKLWK